MAEKLKNMFFTRESVNTFAASLKQNFSEFDIEKFIQLVFDDNWELLELKARMHHTTTCLRQTLPMEFALAIDILMKAGPSISGFEGMTLHDYVELYGMGDFDESLAAIRYFNQFASGEFAIRPFLDANPKKSIKFLLSCADDESEKVRRFASEGCRPRLPWAMARLGFSSMAWRSGASASVTAPVSISATPRLLCASAKVGASWTACSSASPAASESLPASNALPRVR